MGGMRGWTLGPSRTGTSPRVGICTIVNLLTSDVAERRCRTIVIYSTPATISSMPKTVDAVARREELAAAAARVIARSGVAGASMREVATEAGWTTGTLVHYFRNRHELLRFTLETSLEGRRRRRAVRDSHDPFSALRATLHDALPTDDDARLHWNVTIAFCAQAGGDPDFATLQRDAYRDFRSNVTARVIAAGHPASSADIEAERLIAVVDGVALQALFDPESWPPERQSAALDAALANRVG